MSRQKLPATLKKSPKHAQDIYLETLAATEQEYGVGERASRTAFASLKHSYEKIGDHWEEKDQPGPSEPRAGNDNHSRHETFGGVDLIGHTRQELLDMAGKIGATTTTRMTKPEISRALDRRNSQLSRTNR